VSKFNVDLRCSPSIVLPNIVEETFGTTVPPASIVCVCDIIVLFR